MAKAKRTRGASGGRARANPGYLTRYELNLLARHAEPAKSSKLVPLTDDDRRKARDILMATLDTVRSPRNVIASLKTFAAFERVNLTAESNDKPPPPAAVHNTQVNVVSLQGLTNEQLVAMRTTAGLLQADAEGSPSIPAADAGHGGVADQSSQPPGDRD